MNKKHWILIALLTASPIASALDLGDLGIGDMVTDVIKGGKLGGGDIFETIESITEVAIDKATGKPAADTEGSVVIFTQDWCGYCTKALKHMDSKGIPYIKKDLKSRANQKEMKRLGGTGGVPYIVFGEEVMKGFSASGIDKHYAEFKKKHPAKAIAEKGSFFKSGDALKGKIAGVSVYKQPKKTSAKLTNLGKAEAVIYMGEEQDGFYLVTSEKGEGWVDKLLVKK